jgi:hypothetical protein
MTSIINVKWSKYGEYVRINSLCILYFVSWVHSRNLVASINNFGWFLVRQMSCFKRRQTDRWAAGGGGEMIILKKRDRPKSIQDTNTNAICRISQEVPFRDRIHERICDQILKSFPPCYLHSPLLTDFIPPPHILLSKSGLKLVCNSQNLNETVRSWLRLLV